MVGATICIAIESRFANITSPLTFIVKQLLLSSRVVVYTAELLFMDAESEFLVQEGSLNLGTRLWGMGSLKISTEVGI